MKKIVRVKLSSNNDLLNDGEMKKIRGGYSTEDSKGYNCTCKVVVKDEILNENVVIEEKPDVICSSIDLNACCQSFDKKYNQMSCFEIK